MLSGECVWVCVWVCVRENEAGVGAAGEQMVEENLEDVKYVAFLFKVTTTRPSLHPELCLPPSSSFPRYSRFALMNYCYSGTLSVNACLTWGTLAQNTPFCAWLKYQMQLFGLIDRPTLQSAQHASLLPSLMAELLSPLRVREMRPSGLSGSRYRRFKTFCLCLDLTPSFFFFLQC